MNKNIFQGKWNEIKGKVKQQWGKLTEDDLTKIEGSYDELLGRLQKNYGYNQEEARHEITEFLKKNDMTE